jgi:hypothetical protein
VSCWWARWSDLTDSSARYTSIGSTYNTFQNPALATQPPCNGRGEETASLNGIEPKKGYRPAHELVDGTLERLGRGSLPPRAET